LYLYRYLPMSDKTRGARISFAFRNAGRTWRTGSVFESRLGA
jgi:hypothetical protein